jgi:hypothetical protein
MRHKNIDNFAPLINLITGVFLLCFFAFTYLLVGDRLDSWFSEPPVATKSKSSRSNPNSADEDRVVVGIHLQSGLAYGEGFDIVRGTCTACHSAKLVTQNRATREGWQQMIRWMQETQGLWDLGKNEPIVLDYLAKYYAPKETGRRANIDVAEVEWCIFNLG